MSALAPGEHANEHVLAGVLDQLVTAISKLNEATDRQDVLLDLDGLQVLTWTATRRWASYEHGRLWRGVVVFNLDSANDLFVGFAADKAQSAPGVGTGAGVADLVISPRGFLQLPFLGSHVSCGSVGTGPAVVCPLNYAPTINGGRF